MCYGDKKLSIMVAEGSGSIGLCLVGRLMEEGEDVVIFDLHTNVEPIASIEEAKQIII